MQIAALRGRSHRPRGRLRELGRGHPRHRRRRVGLRGERGTPIATRSPPARATPSPSPRPTRARRPQGDAGADGEGGRQLELAVRDRSVRRAARRARRGAARRRARGAGAKATQAQGARLAHLGEPGEDDRQQRGRLLRAALLARAADAQRHRHRRQERAVRGRATPTALIPPQQIGFEALRGTRFADAAVHADRAGAEAAAAPRRSSPASTISCSRRRNLWLTIHESIGHPTELDRALGYEANFAGTSFATPDKLGKLEYGSPLVNVFADKTDARGLATCGYDDDGVEDAEVEPHQEGHASSATRRRASRRRGSARSTSRGTATRRTDASIPFQRMPNVSLAPGTKDVGARRTSSPRPTTASSSMGDGSWSIDHQRYNFQFGGQMFYADRRTARSPSTLRDVAYQSNTHRVLELAATCSAARATDSLRRRARTTARASRCSRTRCPTAARRRASAASTSST